MIDSDNPVVHLCAEGMSAEVEGRIHDARRLFASLYLNLGHSYETVGRASEARIYAAKATAALALLPEGGYREFTRRGIEALFDRMNAMTDPESRRR